MVVLRLPGWAIHAMYWLHVYRLRFTDPNLNRPLSSLLAAVERVLFCKECSDGGSLKNSISWVGNAQICSLREAVLASVITPKNKVLMQVLISLRIEKRLKFKPVVNNTDVCLFLSKETDSGALPTQ